MNKEDKFSGEKCKLHIPHFLYEILGYILILAMPMKSHPNIHGFWKKKNSKRQKYIQNFSGQDSLCTLDTNEACGFGSRFLGLHSTFYGSFMAIETPVLGAGGHRTENQGRARVPTLQKSRR